MQTNEIHVAVTPPCLPHLPRNRTIQTMLPNAATDAELRRRFAWAIPGRLNWAQTICGHPSETPAVIVPGPNGHILDFGSLDRDSSRLANVLTHRDKLGPGDRVAILLGQCPLTAVVHVAAAKAALIALPLFRRFGPDALHYRLADSGASILITDRAGAAKVAPMLASLPDLQTLYCVDGPTDGAAGLSAVLDRANDRFPCVDTRADDPATLIYTSGTTGAPKGALLPFRALLGHLPGVEYPHWPFPCAGDRFWTPADWAWIGGLYDVLLPSLFHGVPVVANPDQPFDPNATLRLIETHRIRNAFLPPTALKLLRAAVPDGPSLGMRSIGSGGESLDEETCAWGARVLGAPINEFYGQTECNLTVASNARLGVVRPHMIGKPVPGHRVVIINDSADIVPPGSLGEIAVHRSDPAMFCGYWKRPEATADKYSGEWMRTGDIGMMDRDGYIAFKGRSDDVINSAGYRIGPSEVEECLLRHPSVATAAVVGAPDPVRGEVVAAFVVLTPDAPMHDDRSSEIADHVRQRLAAHAYPRIVRIVDSLPMTATGKIMRRVLRQQIATERADGCPRSDAS